MFKQHISWFNGILTVFTNKHVAFIRFSCVLVCFSQREIGFNEISGARNEIYYSFGDMMNRR
jgi:hypothetical protein